jgi:cation:H+ antiporter
MSQAALLFAASLAVSVGSSLVLARALDRIGTSLRITDGLLGILTALGADAPEISTAATAMVTNHASVGVGVVLGSNVFNLAGLVGLSALLAGQVRIGRRAALLEGTAALLVAGLAVLLVVGVLPPVAAAVLVVAVLVPYVWLASQRPSHLRRVGPHGAVQEWVSRAAVETQRAARSDHRARAATWRDVAIVPPALACVILASIGMVRAAVAAGDRLSISQAVMGTLVLAVLTSIPNALAAVRLALHGRGAAVISEAFNSNSANVLAGLCIPAAALGLGGRGGVGELTAWWAFAITAFTVWLIAAGRGIGRAAGAGIVLVYAAFVAVVIVR